MTLYNVNDWDVRRFVAVALGLQTAVLALIAIDGVWGVGIPPLRWFLVAAYLSLVPGFSILRILRIRDIPATQAMLLAVGLSVASLMALGLSVNAFYPLIGIEEPLSVLSLSATLIVAISLLLLLAYLRDRSRTVSEIPPTPVPFAWILLFILIPLLTALSVRVATEYQVNALFMAMIPLLALIAVLCSLRRFVPANVLPLALYSIAASLLFTYSCFSDYLIGSDATWELYLSRLTQQRAYWDSTQPVHAYNALLSVTVLPTTYSNLAGLSVNWVFKAFYPLMFAAVPVALYQVYNRVTRRDGGERLAFVAAAFFAFTPTFFSDFPWHAREQIALLFAALALLALFSQLRPVLKGLLAGSFALCIILSSYSTTYLGLYYAAGVLLLLVAFSFFTIERSRGIRHGIWLFVRSNQARIVGIATVVVLCVSITASAWYYLNADSAPLDSLLKVGTRMGDSPSTVTPTPAPEPTEPTPPPSEPSKPPPILDPSTRDSTILELFGIKSLPSPVDRAQRAFALLTLTMIAIGLAAITLRRLDPSKLSRPWVALVFLSVLLLALSVIVPYFSRAIGMIRMYQITLIFLSPIFVMGAALLIHTILSRLTAKKTFHFSREQASLVAVVMLVPYLLLNAGFIHEVTHTVPSSLPLGLTRMQETGDAQLNRDSYGLYVYEAETRAAEWLTSHQANMQEAKIYTDQMFWTENVPLVAYCMVPPESILTFERDTTELTESDAYVFLGYINVAERRFRVVEVDQGRLSEFESDALFGNIENRNRIYSNASSEVYK